MENSDHKKITGKRFEGKVAILTASTMGIGFSIVQRLGLEGASVVVSSRKQKNVDEAVERLKGRGIQVLCVVCHVSNAQHRKNLIDNTLQKYGKIDVVVSNAAVNPSVSTAWADKITQTQESILDKLWEVNVKASILFLKDAAPHLKKGSSIVFISSIAAYQQPASMGMYGVLAAELGPNIRVNCIAPWIVPTPFAECITKNDEAIKFSLERILLKRLGTTEEIAATVAFLASDDASYITGETLVVAGGISSRL